MPVSADQLAAIAPLLPGPKNTSATSTRSSRSPWSDQAPASMRHRRARPGNPPSPAGASRSGPLDAAAPPPASVGQQRIAPAILHVDEAARAIVSRRVPGAPLPAALADPAQRGLAITSVIAQLRSLHAIDPTGIEETSAILSGRRIHADQRGQPGFPE